MALYRTMLGAVGAGMVQTVKCVIAPILAALFGSLLGLAATGAVGLIEAFSSLKFVYLCPVQFFMSLPSRALEVYWPQLPIVPLLLTVAVFLATVAYILESRHRPRFLLIICAMAAAKWWALHGGASSAGGILGGLILLADFVAIYFLIEYWPVIQERRMLRAAGKNPDAEPETDDEDD